jgi:glycine oxidase
MLRGGGRDTGEGSNVKIIVIGAGVAGLAIGWRLAQKGASVTVLDRAQPARGASWAAAGMIAATAEAGEADTPQAELAYHARSLWPDFAREIESASGKRIAYSQPGSLLVATNEAEAAHFAQRARAANDLTWFSRDEARAMEPMIAHTVHGALLAAKEAQVDNRALGAALARCFVRAGGTLVPNEAVVRIEVDQGRAFAVRTPFGYREADAFVLAAGAWSGEISGLPREAVPPVKPMKGEMLALKPPAGTALPARMVWGHDVYLVPRGKRLLIGATLEDAGFDTAVTDAAEDWLSSRALALMPALRDWTIDEHWAGLRPGSPDGLPMLGESAVSGLFIASGQYRNGILFAPAIAEILSRSVLERSPGPKAFDPRRF